MSRANKVLPEIVESIREVFQRSRVEEAKATANHQRLVREANQDHTGRQAGFAAITSLASGPIGQ